MSKRRYRLTRQVAVARMECGINISKAMAYRITLP